MKKVNAHKYEKDLQIKRRELRKRLSKKVQFKNKIFDSALELGKYLRLSDPRSIYKIIKRGEYKGEPVKYID